MKKVAFILSLILLISCNEKNNDLPTASSKKVSTVTTYGANSPIIIDTTGINGDTTISEVSITTHGSGSPAVYAPNGNVTITYK